MELAAELAAARRPFVTATVLRVRRPASVHPGDRALVLADGTIEGFVGGACARESVRLHALRALETGEPLLLRIVAGGGDRPHPGPPGDRDRQAPRPPGGGDRRAPRPPVPGEQERLAPDEPAGHGAIGEPAGHGAIGEPDGREAIDEPDGREAIDEPDGREAIDELAGGGAPDATVAVEHNPCLSGGSLELFLEPRLPAPLVAVLGDAPIARALRTVAGAAGFDVADSQVDGPPADAAALVVAAHGADERRALEAALEAGVPYVALVASRVRGEAVRASLRVPEQLRARLRTPAGLDLGARTPGEVAISILAELIGDLRAPVPGGVTHAAPSGAVRAVQRRAARAAPGGTARSAPSGATAHAGASAVRSARDPVCGMQVVVDERTPHIDTEHGREHFCCEGCRDAYAERHGARA